MKIQVQSPDNPNEGKYDAFIAEGLSGGLTTNEGEKKAEEEAPVKAQEATFRAAPPVPRQPKTFESFTKPDAVEPVQSAPSPTPAPAPSPEPVTPSEAAAPVVSDISEEAITLSEPAMENESTDEAMTFEEILESVSAPEEREIEATGEVVSEAVEEEPQSVEFAENEPEVVPKEEYDALAARLERFQADWENYKRRTERNVEEAKLNANANVAKAMIPALDDFLRAIDHADAVGVENPGVADVAAGMKAIHRKLVSALENEGLVVINPQGEPFDMNCHQAVEKRESVDVAPDTVVEVFQVGYIMNGKVIRPAIVAVAG